MKGLRIKEYIDFLVKEKGIPYLDMSVSCGDQEVFRYFSALFRVFSALYNIQAKNSPTKKR